MRRGTRRARGAGERAVAAAVSVGAWNLGEMVDNRAHAALDRRNIPGRFSQRQNEIPRVEQRAVPRGWMDFDRQWRSSKT